MCFRTEQPAKTNHLSFVLSHNECVKYIHLLCIDIAQLSVQYRCSACLSGYNYGLFVCASVGADRRCKRSQLLQESLQRSNTVVCFFSIPLGSNVNSLQSL